MMEDYAKTNLYFEHPLQFQLSISEGKLQILAIMTEDSHCAYHIELVRNEHQ